MAVPSSWGRGIRKIVDGMTKAGLPRPKIEDADGGVRITIYRNTGVAQDVAQDVAQGATELQRQILGIIRKNPRVSRADIAVQCGKSVKTIERRLGAMTHLVKYVGSGYSGHWEIVTCKLCDFLCQVCSRDLVCMSTEIRTETKVRVSYLKSARSISSSAAASSS